MCSDVFLSFRYILLNCCILVTRGKSTKQHYDSIICICISCEISFPLLHFPVLHFLAHAFPSVTASVAESRCYC